MEVKVDAESQHVSRRSSRYVHRESRYIVIVDLQDLLRCCMYCTHSTYVQ